MIPAIKNYISEHLLNRPVAEKPSAEAYDLWSDDYDMQPGNLMLDLDEILFAQFLEKIDLKSKAVADIGCGTGRHWSKMLIQNPLTLTGFDVSQGMLNKLREKYPLAKVCKIDDDAFTNARYPPFDIIVSTLTVAHIENMERALNAWCGMLKANAEIIITDFHPKMLTVGGKRTFKHNNKPMAVKNYVHPIDTIKNILQAKGFRLIAEEGFIIDETVKHYYQAQNALPVYERFKGFPVIYGIHLKRGNDPE
ncbi:MAG: class I SAM-dependent DNA methyltransferase [Sphingobacteriales bacterium]